MTINNIIFLSLLSFCCVSCRCHRTILFHPLWEKNVRLLYHLFIFFSFKFILNFVWYELLVGRCSIHSSGNLKKKKTSYFNLVVIFILFEHANLIFHSSRLVEFLKQKDLNFFKFLLRNFKLIKLFFILSKWYFYSWDFKTRVGSLH